MINTRRALDDARRVQSRLGAIAQSELGVEISVFSNRPNAPRVLDKLRSKGARFIEQQEARRLARLVAESADEGIEAAWRTTRGQKVLIYADVAKRARRLVLERIRNNRVGTNAPRYAARKARMVKAGKMTGKYGNPPPFAVATGQLADNLRVDVRKGRS